MFCATRPSKSSRECAWNSRSSVSMCLAWFSISRNGTVRRALRRRRLGLAVARDSERYEHESPFLSEEYLCSAPRS
jgi:hypothetical protein